MIKRLVKPGGEIIFRGLPGLEGWWRYPDFEDRSAEHFERIRREASRSARGEITPYLDETIEWLHEHVDPDARVETRPAIRECQQVVFLVVPV
jgi:hypothetical protein